MKKKKIGFALGGGGARGLAHIGAIKALLEAGIKPDLIVGSSIGAIAGALYATLVKPEAVINKIHEYFTCECFKKLKFDFLQETEEISTNDGLFDALSRFLRKRFFNVALARQQSFISLDHYMDNIAMLMDDIAIEDTAIPFAVVCTDIQAGKEVVLTEGPLRVAVAASSAIPGIFPPIAFNETLLTDGGWVDQLPTAPCRALGADLVIAVDVSRELEQNYNLDTGLDILRRTNAITRATLNSLQKQDADFVITPGVGDISWAGFDCVENCMLRGKNATDDVIPAIKKYLDTHSPL